MEDALYKIRVWASHGTMKQFSSEVIAKLSKIGVKAELEGDTLTCYVDQKKGGVLGIGGKKERKVLLTITRKGDEVEIPADKADPAFVQQLAELLKQH